MRTQKATTQLALVLLIVASIIFIAASADTTVYITRTGKCYHRGTCRYLSKSKIPISLGEAVKRYRACSVCNPPTLDRAAPSKKETKKEEKKDSTSLVKVQLSKVIDGDTIRVRGDQAAFEVDLIGIDAPEIVQEKDGTLEEVNEPYSKEAKDFFTKLLADRDIWLEYDKQRIDKDDRNVAYVWAKGKSEKEKMLVNAQMLRKGLAVLHTVKPNVKYAKRFNDAQKAAKKEKLGIWG